MESMIGAVVEIAAQNPGTAAATTVGLSAAFAIQAIAAFLSRVVKPHTQVGKWARKIAAFPLPMPRDPGAK